MARLELAKPGLKNLSLDRFAFIPTVQTSLECGRGESNSYDPGFKSEMFAG
jgi:hypothetical protein